MRKPFAPPAPESVEVIKRTELPNNVVVETIRRSDLHLIRPFQTFVVMPTSQYALRLTDFATEAAALHQHKTLAERLRVKSSPGEQK